MFSALQYSLFIMNLVSSFIYNFLFTSFQQKNEIKKKGNKQLKSKFYVKDALYRFQKKLDGW